MNNKILWITIIGIICSSSLLQSKKLQDPRWAAIASDIADESDANDRGEFEAAKQALLNIESDTLAKKTAKKIAARFTQSIDAGIKQEATEKALIDLKRYPKMDAPAIKQATIELFKKPNIDTFLKNEGIAVTLP